MPISLTDRASRPGVGGGFSKTCTAPPQQRQPPSLWLPSPARGRGARGEGRTDLDGLGDAVFIATGGIYVLQGERMISIGAGNTSEPEVRERLRQL
ncbi:MAG: hypothetical protein MUC77_18005 [Chromatiaceae bacterium]|nr:hypothetical protein [Chromatiaceae bacterium]